MTSLHAARAAVRQQETLVSRALRSGTYTRSMTAELRRRRFTLTAIALRTETCECGQWPVEEYGPVCPSCRS